MFLLNGFHECALDKSRTTNHYRGNTFISWKSVNELQQRELVFDNLRRSVHPAVVSIRMTIAKLRELEEVSAIPLNGMYNYHNL